MQRSVPLGPLRLGAAFTTVLLVVGAAGLVRVGRQFPGAFESLSLLAPFVSPVLALSLEVAVLVALPSWVPSVSRLGDGAAAVGARRDWRTLAGGLLAAMALLALAELLPRGSDKPGTFANDLVAAARDGCSPGERVQVPLLGLRVDCDAEGLPLAGSLPGGQGAQVKVSELVFAPDLRGGEAAQLDLSLKRPRSLSLRLRAEHATLRGLAPWARPSGFEPWLRWLLVFFTASVVAAAALLLGGHERTRAATVLGAFAGAASAVAVVWLDQEVAALPMYAVAALAGCATLGVGGRLLRRPSSATPAPAP